jgi:endonuclease-3 related protein
MYSTLLNSYGPQGWWPLLELENRKPVKISKSGSLKGYHPGDYSYPKTKAQQFEICVGAILTQNTAWPNVEKALLGLKVKNLLSPASILKASPDELCEAIRPAGYFNQKAKKLRLFAGSYLKFSSRVPKREELLEIWGIGPETADSMLLYAFKVPTFVVDAYTRRILPEIGYRKKKPGYDEIKRLFEANLPRDHRLYQEYHALIVEHAKRKAALAKRK